MVDYKLFSQKAFAYQINIRLAKEAVSYFNLSGNVNMPVAV